MPNDNLPNNFEEIYDTIVANLVNKIQEVNSSFQPNISDSSIFGNLTALQAQEIYELYQQLQLVKNNTILNNAEGENLTNLAYTCGITRLPAQTAYMDISIYFRFESGDNEQNIIPGNTQFRTDSSDLGNFQIPIDSQITLTRDDFPENPQDSNVREGYFTFTRCFYERGNVAQTGKVNISKNSIAGFVGNPSVPNFVNDDTNPILATASYGGRNIETDNELKARFPIAISRQGAFNINGIYQSVLNSDSRIREVYVLENSSQNRDGRLPAHSAGMIVRHIDLPTTTTTPTLLQQTRDSMGLNIAQALYNSTILGSTFFTYILSSPVSSQQQRSLRVVSPVYNIPYTKTFYWNWAVRWSDTSHIILHNLNIQINLGSSAVFGFPVFNADSPDNAQIIISNKLVEYFDTFTVGQQIFSADIEKYLLDTFQGILSINLTGANNETTRNILIPVYAYVDGSIINPIDPTTTGGINVNISVTL